MKIIGITLIIGAIATIAIRLLILMVLADMSLAELLRSLIGLIISDLLHLMISITMFTTGLILYFKKTNKD